MPKDFQLQLNTPPNGTYFPGSVVSGTLLLTTDEAKEYGAIQVSLKGFSRVDWTETKNYGGTPQTYNFYAQDDLINLSTVVWDKKEHGGGGKFPPGSYQWPFTFILEGTSLPPSYEDEIGTIRYAVSAKIVKDALLKFDTKEKVILSVENVVPLNRPDLLQPQTLSVEKTLCCLFCASAPIHITARIPRTGYCIRQDAISLEVEVENGSNSEVHNLSAIIKQVAVYTADHWLNKTTRVKTVLQFPPSNPVPARSTYVWKPTQQVPLLPTTITNCSHISVSYILEVSASLSGALDPKLDFPIFLGNVPVLGTIHSSDKQPLAGGHLGSLPPDGTLLPTGAPPPTNGTPPASGLGDMGPSPTQTILNSGYPDPATAYASNQAPNFAPGGGQNGLAAPSQSAILQRKSSPKSAQLPKGFVDPIRRS